jgi:transcriptional regulator with XRE-family HTH domain
MSSLLGHFLQEARVKARLSQKEVSDNFGYKSAQVISDWERGVRSPPANVLRKLVKLYRVPLDKFFDIILEEKTSILEKKLRKSLGLKTGT